jgi:tetratricopeptide (TPR) repeat protein
MAGFPWSELGLDGPADERGIRRAYAARLRIVRPDLDAAGFQRLVQARDAALRATLHTAQRPLLRQTPPSEPPPKPEAPAPESRPPQPDGTDPPEARKQAPPFIIDLGPSKRTADTDQPDDKPPVESPPLEIELAAGSASSPAARQPPPSPQPRPVTVDVDPPQSPPTVTEPGAKPPPAKPAVVDQAKAVAGPDTVSALLSAFCDAWSSNHEVLPPVAPILQGLGEQSIVARQKLEIEALRAVASLLGPNLFDLDMPRERQKAARSLTLGLDDDYAWSSNDRRLHQMMPQAAADQVARLLRVVREWEDSGLAPNFAPPPKVKTRQQNPGGWAFGGIAFLILAIVRGLSTLTPHYTAPPTPTSLSYTSAAQLNQINATVSFNRGVEYDNNSQFDRAIRAYDEAIRLNPNYPSAFYNRALDFANQGNLDRAIEDYDRANRLDPVNPDYLVSRGVAYHGKGQYDRAIQDYDQAIGLRPDHALALVDRGIAYASKSEYARAIQDYDQAIRINRNDADAWRNRGLARQAKGDVAGGAADLAIATHLDAPSPQAEASKQVPSTNSDSSPSATPVKQAN